jgi:murein DD-endopeptidase MepM/ murein hydrolase activator NlpD/uncharacterized protein YgiM (DUF1202 family)
VHSATTTLSPRGRIRTVALAATIALGTLFPSISAATAQDDGFDISVTSTSGLSGLTAVVSGSDNGLRLRSEPAHDADVIDTLIDGTVVTLRVDQTDTVRDPDGTTRWWPVSYNGSDGWVSGFYLSESDATAGSDGTEAETADTVEEVPAGESFSFEGDSMVGATAKVAGSGESVNLRSEPSTSSELVTTLSDGAVVDLRIDVLDTVVDGDIRWWPISSGGTEGWVAGQFLTANDGSSAEPEPSSGAFAAGSYAVTHTGDGDGVNLRAEVEGDVLETLDEGTVVQIMEGPSSFSNSEAGWFKVTTGDLTGFVDGDLLRVADQPSTDPDPAASNAFVAGDYALVETQTQAGARIRAGGSPESEKIGFVPETDIVQIVSGPASYESSDRGWFEVSYNGTTGYVDGDLLVKTEAPEIPVEETPEPAAPGNGFVAGDAVVTNSLTGVGVNVRVAPGTTSDRAGFLADLSALSIVEGPSKDVDLADWYKVTNGDLEGWVAGEFLQRADEAQPPAETPAAQFVAPLDSYIVSQNFGCSNLGYYSYNAAYGCNIHDGIDLATSSGTTLKASGDGTVVFSGWCDCGLGYYVEIDHGNGVHSVYGHMESQPIVEVGQVMTQGEAIGPLGSTGLSTGPHVHFMFRVNGTAVNPRDYVEFAG